MALSLPGPDIHCGGRDGGNLASDEHVSVETSDSVERIMTVRLIEGLQKWRVRRETVVQSKTQNPYSKRQYNTFFI